MGTILSRVRLNKKRCLLALPGKMTVGNVQAMLQYSKQFSQPFTSLAGMAASLRK